MCDDSKESALNVATERLKKGKWPLYRGTRNRKGMQEGDTCLFYLAGKEDLAQHIIAIAEVSSKRDSVRHEQVDSEDLLIDSPDQILLLKNIDLIKPIPIRSFLGKLSFLSKKKWGAAFQGGCRKLTGGDAQILAEQIERRNIADFR